VFRRAPQRAAESGTSITFDKPMFVQQREAEPEPVLMGDCEASRRTRGAQGSPQGRNIMAPASTALEWRLSLATFFLRRKKVASKPLPGAKKKRR